jgi:hypothetical protein
MATRKPGSSQSSTNKRTAHSPRSISRRTGKTIKAAVDDFCLIVRVRTIVLKRCGGIRLHLTTL